MLTLPFRLLFCNIIYIPLPINKVRVFETQISTSFPCACDHALHGALCIQSDTVGDVTEGARFNCRCGDCCIMTTQYVCHGASTFQGRVGGTGELFEWNTFVFDLVDCICPFSMLIQLSSETILKVII